MKKIIIILMLLLTGFPVFSQNDKILERTLTNYNNPEALVSLSASLPFNKAIDLMSKVSEKLTGKRIVSQLALTEPIGIEINNMHYLKALLVIVQYKGLMFEEREDVIVVKRKDEDKKDSATATYAPIDSREVKISAVFFDINTTESRARGLDWKVLLSQNNVDLGGQMGNPSVPGSTTDETSVDFSLGANIGLGSGGSLGQATAVFKFFENQNLGEVVASPNVTVNEGREARLQVGQDFSIKQKDFAGNVIETFYSAGTILRVTPYVYKQDGVDYILLQINAEKSSFVPDETTTIINKTQAQTQVLMLDGEETIIGGLFNNDETTVRSGIPFLKDLPWWVFGLRYVFGSDEKKVTKRELVILIRVELVPTIKERLAFPNTGNSIEKEIRKQKERLKMYQFNEVPETETPTKEN